MHTCVARENPNALAKVCTQYHACMSLAMFCTSRKCLQVYLVCLCLLVLVLLLYQAYSLWRTQRDHYCLYNHCEEFDREKMCRNTNTSVMHNCHNPSCTERLSNDSYHSFAKCFNKSWSGELDVRFINTGCCHFLKGEGRRAVMLASYPGSGNTWVRGLLERITGLCTGSIYCDMAIRRSGFIGESVTGPEVLVVKTHKKESWMDNKPAIYIIRDPAKAIVSYWNFRSTPTHSHRRTQPPIMFGNNTEWIKFFHVACNNWRRSVLKWSNRGNASLLVVTYEDMVEDTLTEMTRMMQFLQLPFERSTLWRRLKSDFSTFQRHTGRRQKYYTLEQTQHLLHMMNGVYRKLLETDQTLLASIVQTYLNAHSSSSNG